MQHCIAMPFSVGKDRGSRNPIRKELPMAHTCSSWDCMDLDANICKHHQFRMLFLSWTSSKPVQNKAKNSMTNHGHPCRAAPHVTGTTGTCETCGSVGKLYSVASIAVATVAFPAHPADHVGHRILTPCPPIKITEAWRTPRLKSSFLEGVYE